jgi:hypothetical protein
MDTTLLLYAATRAPGMLLQPAIMKQTPIGYRLMPPSVRPRFTTLFAHYLEAYAGNYSSPNHAFDQYLHTLKKDSEMGIWACINKFVDKNINSQYAYEYLCNTYER